MNFVVTHYKLMPIDSDGWVPLPMITRDAESQIGPFYFGTDKRRELSFSEVHKMHDNNQVVKVINPFIMDQSFPITEQQRTWLTPDGEIYIADRKDPINDKEKILIGKVQ